MLSFSQCEYFFTITAQLTLQQFLQHILNIYIRYCLQLHKPSILTLLLLMLYFSQYDIFSQLLHNWLYNNFYSISSTYTYDIVYNYTTQYTGFAVYICFLYTMWHFFTITAQLTLQQCLQHILNIYMRYCLQLYTQYADFSVYICFPFHNVNIFPQLLYNCLFHYVYSEASLDTYCAVYNYSPEYTVCAVYICCPFHNVIFFHNYCTIDYNNVYSISSTYTYSTVCNYSPQYTGFAVYICFPFHNVIFFHNDCTIHSTTMFTAYPQHIHTILFEIHYLV